MASTPFICDKCLKSFTSNWNLKRHKKRCTVFDLNENLHKCLEGCGISFNSCDLLKVHLKLEHNFLFEENQLEFPSHDEFLIWLKEEEQTENIRFFKLGGIKRNKDGTEKYTLKCSRSGKQVTVPEERRQRAQKKQGSSKLNFACTSQITVKKEHSTSKCVILYTSTHYGHGEEIEHLRVSKLHREEMAQKLLIGVSPTSESTINLEEPSNSTVTEDLRCKVWTEMTKFNNTFDTNIYSNETLTHLHCLLKECNSLNFNSNTKKTSAKKSVSIPNILEAKVITERLNESLFISNNCEYDHSYLI